MMKFLAGACLWLLISINANTMATAKDCSCEQHKAKASGQGSCSLAEDPSLCSIKYSASQPGKAPAAVAVNFSKEYRSQLPILETFDRYNKGFKPSKPEFRDLLINVLAISELPRESSVEFVKIFGLEEPPTNFSTKEFDSAFGQFSSSRCFDAKTRNLRVMFIAIDSPFNEKCPELR
jgi:hypothetical protein